MKEHTWEELKALEVGTIVHDEIGEGLRFIIMRGPASLCAYIGMTKDHPLAGWSYDDIPISAHGGLTFAGKGDDFRPKDMYWYGWDYTHSGDYNFYDYNTKGKKWLVKDVIDDCKRGTLYEAKKLMRLVEHIYNKALVLKEEG